MQKNYKIILVFLLSISLMACGEEPVSRKSYDISQKARKGDMVSQYKMGMIYGDGIEVSKDFNTARNWFEQAAKQGHVKSQTILGRMYLNGVEGIKKDSKKALSYLSSAAKKSDPQAQFLLSNIYAHGGSTLRSKKKSVYWLNLSVQKEYPPAIFEMGMRHLLGEGMLQDDFTALELIKKAAVSKNVDAQIKMGEIYIKGELVPKNLPIAKSWINKAHKNNKTTNKQKAKIKNIWDKYELWKY